jgi:serine O-acetyltransferase
MEERLVRMMYDSRPQVGPVKIRRDRTAKFFDRVVSILFPTDGERECYAALRADMSRAEADFLELLSAAGLESDAVRRISDRFFEGLSGLCRCLQQDAEFILDNDPAADSIEEVVLAYPGFYAIVAYRVANLLRRMQVPTIPRLVTEYAHERTGVDIHPGAQIGCPFFLDHGTGVVIGETAKIGDRVKIYQGVTLGALSVDKDLADKQRHPTIGDDVVLYASATVLGGDTHVGEGSIIGGNVWLTESVPARSVVYHRSTVKIRREDDAPEASEAPV